MSSLDNVVVKTEPDITRVVAPYSVNGNARELFMRGIEELQKAKEAYERTIAELEETGQEMGGYAPAKPADPLLGRHWIDDIIIRRLDGKREGLIVQWKLQSGTYNWDPTSKELKKC